VVFHMGAPTLQDFEGFYEGYDKEHLVSYPEQIAALLIIFGLLLPGLLLGISLMLQKRYWSHPIIKSRHPELAILEVCAASVSILSFLFPFAFVNKVYAGVPVFLNTFCAFLAFFTAVFRLATLSVSLIITSRMSKKDSLDDALLMKQTLWVRYSKLRKFPYNVIIIFSFVWLVTLPNFLDFLKLGMKWETSFFAFHFLYGSQNPFLALVLFGLGSFLSLIFWRKIKSTGVENFGIQRELGGKVYVLATFLISLIVGGMVPLSFQVRYFHIQVLLFSIAQLIELYFTLWQVLWVSHLDMRMMVLFLTTDASHSAHLSSSTPGSWGTREQLDSILNDPVLLELFREFLCRELTVEHLNFIEAVHSFNTKHTASGNEERQSFVLNSKLIYNVFCDPDCAAPINISFTCREQLRISIEKIASSQQDVDISLFERAYKDVTNLLAQDSLMRFMRDVKFIDNQNAVKRPSVTSMDASVFQV
jgi:hypothetical protein